MADEIQPTLKFGEAAFGQIRANDLSAVPRHYEFWYIYSAGYNLDFNKAVNERLAKNSKLNADDIAQLYNRFLTAVHVTEKIEEVSDSLSSEITKVIAQIKDLSSNNSQYSDNLQGITEKLDDHTTITDLKELVSVLASETKSIISANRELEAQIDSSQRQVAELREEFEVIRTQTLTDELTTLSNRRHFEQTLRNLVNESNQTGMGFALIMTDIDHFKKFNDTYGHQTGDQVLRLVGVAVRQNVKGDDIAFRYGGEEFAVLLPRASLAQAFMVAENIRKSVMSKELVKRSTGENLGRITISSGVAQFKPGDTMISIVERADECLYTAKASGRNQVRTEDSEVVSSVA